MSPSALSLSKPSSPDRVIPAASDKASKDTMSSSLSFLTNRDAKDQRAYEHIRHKVKKAADTVKLKAQKKRSPPQSPTKTTTHSGRPTPRANHTFVVSDDEDVPDDAVLIDSVNLPEPLSQATTPRLESIKLGDLIVAPPRKPHKRNDADFELIPHVRSVIVLDDFAARDVPTTDEPWEHIYSEEEDDTTTAKVPSYATVVLSSSPKRE